ncbi:MAG TPA: NAD(+) diphosphatase [Magnetospirillum sp.]|nr:NAD(+) diphosphatase [Magnetospirillum sp.]
MSDILYGAVPLDRAHTFRRDAEALADLRRSPDKLVVPTWREMSLVNGAAQLPELARQSVFLMADHAGSAAAVLAHGTPAAELLDMAGDVVFLGLNANKAPVFAADLSKSDPEADGDGPALGLGGAWVGLRAVGALLPAGDAALLGYARAMMIWHRRSRFCGSCGAPTEVREGGHMRQCLDTSCGAQHYPRTDPAVIMRVTDGDNVLLHRQRPWPAGQWSVLAGFVEPGETFEEAVAREVREETGIEVAAVAYAGSQPWPFPGSVMLAFTARAVGGTLAPDPHELEDARWFSRSEILTAFDDRHRAERTGLFLPTPGSISRRLIEQWLGRA